jgi:hypothetical protein
MRLLLLLLPLTFLRALLRRLLVVEVRRRQLPSLAAVSGERC